MRIVVIYTWEIPESEAAADFCQQSGRKHGYHIEKYPSVFYQDMDEIHEDLGLKRRHPKGAYPETRIANGTTHYLLYLECIQDNEPICILEHDAEVVGRLPEPREGVIQVSSHCDRQLLKKSDWAQCMRGQKMRKRDSGRDVVWSDEIGVVRHPLNGTNGTSGYIITPTAAEKMVAVVKAGGIAFADRIRTEYIGDNLWLQKPQSVLAHHSQARSHRLIRSL